MRFLLLTLLIFRVYAIPFSHEFVLSKIEFAKPNRKVPFTGFYRLNKQTKEFFYDLGATFLDKNEHGFSGMYLSRTSVRKNSGKTFGKWKQILKNPKNTKLLELFEGNLSSNNLRELFSFPGEVIFQKNAKNKTVLLFLDYTIPATMQIREILNFSLRGFSVLVVDFHQYKNGNNFPPWNECKQLSKTAYNYISENVILYGKSFGSAPATFLATKYPYAQLILDRPFTCMKEVVGSFFFDSFIATHYSYPTNSLITQLKRHPLIISSSENTTFKNHAEHLMNLYIKSRHTENSTEIYKQNFIQTKGGHYSTLLNNGKNSWFSYNEAQRKLNKFFNKISQ